MSRSCSRPATACCSRPGSGTGCSSVRPISRSSRSAVPPTTRRSSSTRSNCRPRQLRPDREFTGQRFTRHRAALAAWQPWHRERIRAPRPRDRRRDAEVWPVPRVVRPAGEPSRDRLAHDTEFQFLFVLGGTRNARRRRSRNRVHARARRRGVDPRRRSAGRCATAVPIWSCSTSRFPAHVTPR